MAHIRERSAAQPEAPQTARQESFGASSSAILLCLHNVSDHPVEVVGTTHGIATEERWFDLVTDRCCARMRGGEVTFALSPYQVLWARVPGGIALKHGTVLQNASR